MKLFTRDPYPSDEQIDQIQKILAHAASPVRFADLSVSRPNHYVAAWRVLTAWAMSRVCGVSQAALAEWFGLNQQYLNRCVRGVDAVVAAGYPTSTCEIIEKIKGDFAE